MKKHYLKCWPEYYAEVEAGRKMFEARFNDRKFKENDFVVLQEYNPKTEKYTGKEKEFKISYVLDNYAGLQPGYVVFAMHSTSIGCQCREEDKRGETDISCCNHCGKPVEAFWIKQPSPIPYCACPKPSRNNHAPTPYCNTCYGVFKI